MVHNQKDEFFAFKPTFSHHIRGKNNSINRSVLVLLFDTYTLDKRVGHCHRKMCVQS